MPQMLQEELTQADPRLLDTHRDVPLENRYGHFLMGAYLFDRAGITSEHLVVYGSLLAPTVSVRLNSACFTGDLLGCARCDCAAQFDIALRRIAERGEGLVIYHLDHEGRGNGIVQKLRSFGDVEHEASLEERYTRLTDQRHFDEAAMILNDLQISRVRLLSNSPVKRQALERGGIDVVEVESVISTDPELVSYYEFKRNELGHVLDWAADE